MKYALALGAVTVLALSPLNAAYAASCASSSNQVKELRAVQTQVRASVLQYRKDIAAKFTNFQRNLGGIETRSQEIRGNWQGNAPQPIIAGLMQDEVILAVDPLNENLARVTDAFENNLEAIFSQASGKFNDSCTASISQSIRILPITQTYTKASNWRDGLGIRMAVYRVRVTSGMRSANAQLRLSARNGELSYSLNARIQPSVAVQMQVQSERRDRRTVNFNRQLMQGDDNLQIRINSAQ